MSERMMRFEPRGVHYAQCYGLLLGVLVLAYLLFAVWTGTARVLAGEAFSSEIESVYAMRSVIQLSYVVVGIGSFVAVLAAEAYMRGGISGRRKAPELGRRFVRVVTPMAVLLVLGVILRVIAMGG